MKMADSRYLERLDGSLRKVSICSLTMLVGNRMVMAGSLEAQVYSLKV